MPISTFQYQQMLLRMTRKEAPAPVETAVEYEADLHQQIADECQRRGWICFRGSTAHRTHRTLGEPDYIIATDDGRTLYVECKSKRGKPTAIQNATLAWLLKNNQRATIVRSLEEFITFAAA